MKPNLIEMQLQRRLATEELTGNARSCPTCSGVHLIFAQRHGIQLASCPSCRGVWLPRAELDKILGRVTVLSTGPRIRPAPMPGNSARTQHSGREPAFRYGEAAPPGHHSWLTDLFD